MKNKTGKRIFLLTLIASMVLSFTAVSYADEPNDITKYDMRVSASPDKTYKVTEEITANFPSGTHQIEKVIPMSGIKIENPKSKTSDISLKKEKDNYVITVGSDDVAARGEDTLQFSYMVRAYDSADISNDEFKFVLLPDGWKFDIQEFKAHISLPKDFQENAITVLTAEGEPISGGISKTFSNNAVDIKGSNISAMSGLSCSITLPDSYWIGASTDDNMKYIVIGLLVIVPFLIFIFWLIAGRDPRRTKGIFHYPPEDMTPMEMGYIVDGKTDYSDAASMVLYFAQRGYLTIEEYERGHIRIVKKMNIPMRMEKPFAVTLFDALFENSDSITVSELDREFGHAYMDAGKELRRYYSGSRRLFTRISRIMRGISIILACLPAAGIIAASAIYKMEMKELLLAAPALILVLGGCCMMARAYDRKFVLSRGTRIKRYVIGIIMIAIAALGAGYYTMDVFGINFGIGAIASTGISVLFIMMIKARTKHSSMWLDQILGLKAFIKAGDYNTAAILNGKKPGYYYDILPYAYALGLMDKWSKTFTKTEPGVPEWYRQFGVTKEVPVELLESDMAEEEKPQLPQPEEKPMSLQERLFGVKDKLKETEEKSAEAPEEIVAPAEENIPAIVEEDSAEEKKPEMIPQQKKGFLGQIAQWGDRFKPHPELDFIRKFNFDDFVKTIKSEIDRLSDGIVERMNN